MTVNPVKLFWRIVRWAVLLFFASTVLVTLIYRWVPVPLTPLMVIRCVQQVGRGETPRLKHDWVPLSEISPALPCAVISSEDQRFLQHNGFDAQAIGYAVRQRLNGGKSGGGSTISQQTAKNVFLWPTSSWVRKGFEVYFTVLIELLWSKERIMEVYLNSIEMGDGIYGAEAVAQENFHCSASELSRKNCAMIAASLPAPLRFNSAEPTPYMRSRQRWILRQMKHIKPWENTTKD